MTLLTITINEGKQNRPAEYKNQINPKDYRLLALFLGDLRSLGMPIDRAIKEYKSGKSDWNVALGLE